eukprot:UN00970
MIVASILLYLLTNCAFSVPESALKNECKKNTLSSGTYRFILPDDQTPFYVHCMVDGTMYINPEQQSLYRYHKEAALEMKFESILSADYESESDIDIENLPKLCDEDDDEESFEYKNYDYFDEQDETSTNMLWAFVIFCQGLYFALGIYAYIFWWGFCKRSTWGVSKENKSMNDNIRFGCRCCRK